VLGSLAGKVAGVQVVGASGASLGGTQKIKIRGVNSLNGNDQPLIVVDGTPISNSNFGSSIGNGPDLGNLGQDVNPDDIETVNVLKGPAASASLWIKRTIRRNYNYHPQRP
jgi:outer membrane receptor for ferrienterochelin and colicin